MGWHLEKKSLPLWKKLIYAVLLLGSIYAFSIVWRVSAAEQEYLGRSHLLPFFGKKKEYTDPSLPESYGSPTFDFELEGKPTKIWREKINGFQHVYGSALIAYELGEVPSNFIFCSFEHFKAFTGLERLFSPSENKMEQLKDLAHNKLGRTIGSRIKKTEPRGRDAEKGIIGATIGEMAKGQQFYSHQRDPRILNLKLKQLECLGL